jgi:sulfite exporter TauE/SafE
VRILADLLARFSEPSSYAGLGAILALAGWNLPDPALAQLVQLLAAACGLIALCLKDRDLRPAIALVLAAAPAFA